MERKREKVTVLGAGSWGTALAMVLADNGHEVRLWGHNSTRIDEINQQHTNKKYLPEITLPATIVGYSSLEESLIGIKTVIMAVPTKDRKSVV